VKTVEELGIPELNSKQVERVCAISEENARKYVLSQIAPKNITTLNICAEVEGTKPVKLSIDIDMVLLPSSKDCDAQKIADEAVKYAFNSAEEYLRRLACNSQT
jgi:acid phosphatase class B